jgi:hypothetical protein
MGAETPETKGKRRPDDADLEPILALLWDGKSLRAACLDLGLDTPSVSKWLDDDEGRCQQYARACEGRAEYLQEDAITVNRAAALGVQVAGKKVDPSGAKGYLDAVKWSTARMAPKKAPVQRVEHLGDMGSRTDDEIAARIESLEALANGED